MHQSNQEALIVIEGRATYERMMSAACDGDPEEAVRQLQNFLKVYPEFAQAHNDIAVIYHRSGNALKALAHHERAHKLAPLNLTFRKNLADFYAVELDWVDEAIHIYLEILKDNPFDIETLNALGTLNERSGRKEQARQFYARALQLDPLSVDARNALHLIGGDSFAMEGVVPAAPRLAVAIAEPPPSPDELYREATNAASTGRAAEALCLLEKLVASQPSHAAAINDLGVLYQQAGDLQRSRKCHEEAARLAPDNGTFRKNLADLLSVCFQEYEEALQMYIELLGKNPRDIELLKGVAYICIENGKPGDAETFLQRVLAIEPWNAEARETLRQIREQAQKEVAPAQTAKEMHAEAVRLSQEGKTAEAKALLERLLGLYGGYAVAYNDLGVLRYEAGDVEGARQAYERAVELEPANIISRRNLADLYFAALGMTDDAVRIYLELHRQNPRDVETLVNMGHLCSAINRPDEAKSFYRRALEIEPWNQDARTAMQQL